MASQKFEGDTFEFPDEKEEKSKFKADEPELKIEIEDDTPPQDRGRKAAPPPDELTDDELNSYDEKVQSRFKKFTRGYHDERRAKEQAMREKEAAEEFDGLTAINTAFVHISFTGANKPAVLTGQTEAGSAPITNYKYLLMPMRYSS